MSIQYDITDKNILITGCTSGIGKAVAMLAAEAGAHIACLGRDEQKLNELTKALPGQGHRAYLFDSTDLPTVEAAVGQAAKDMGAFSGLLHSAGVGRPLLLRDMNFDAAAEMMQVNYMLFLALAKAACRRGRYVAGEMSVVAISSYAAFSLEPVLTAYAASKAAVNAAVQCLAREYAARGVRFNAIAPSYVNTRMNDVLKASIGEEVFNERVKKNMPLGIIEPEDIAQTALFLLSDASAKTTGTIMPVTSGGGSPC